MERPTRLRRAAPLMVLSLVAAASPLGARAAGPCPSGMAAVEGGMLAPEGRDPVSLNSFCLDRNEVTVDAYATCAAAGACKADDLQCGNAATWGKKGFGSHPINCVTWAEAETFCREHGKRLPTEEEWEWAARGGLSKRTFPWGEVAPAARACWDGDGNDKGKGLRKTTCPVGSFPAGRTPEGIQDLAGNVREWTSTAHDRHRVIRGGSWGDSAPEFLSASFRGWNVPDERIELLGFRCAAPIGALARVPVRKPKDLEAARTRTDEAGVMIFNEPMLLGARRR
ncbi:MAG TPA: SUMF1/EgtB/PvdO family nonheme iron enzyme [Anaeromyxobacteraceae bacterium]|nr:SUMF1/EgtB/PvdO family nonheme iron enzyme [Anaeromyxobacteraceae bacterium]